ncbi:MAG: carbohydrate kinase [Gammaproteobacteria bacterium]|nr:carbohydrate kinase [Gammaproteobacteria bacterium]
MTITTAQSMNPIVFGEVLFDLFDDEEAVLGGAPFNVAWHLHGFGVKPLFISRVGKDVRGQQVITLMQQWGMRTDGIQFDKQHMTGTVCIRLNNGQPDYDITGDVAYDHIQNNSLHTLITNYGYGLLYHGSLVTRHPDSRHTLQQLRRETMYPVFIDINLRAPWDDRQQAESLLNGARWLKLNEEELEILTGTHYDNRNALHKGAEKLLQQYQLESLIVTLGNAGAFIISQQGVFDTLSAATEDLVDTVGAGDALSAVFILGILHGWNQQLALQRGVEFASVICQQQGATSQDKGLYQRLLDKWME